MPAGSAPASADSDASAAPAEKKDTAVLTEACSLFVGCIPPDASEQGLRDLFESVGTVVACRLIKDWETGVSRGFGFVIMATQQAAAEAVSRLHDYQVRSPPAKSLADLHWLSNPSNWRLLMDTEIIVWGVLHAVQDVQCERARLNLSAA